MYIKYNFECSTFTDNAMLYYYILPSKTVMLPPLLYYEEIIWKAMTDTVWVTWYVTLQHWGLSKFSIFLLLTAQLELISTTALSHISQNVHIRGMFNLHLDKEIRILKRIKCRHRPARPRKTKACSSSFTSSLYTPLTSLPSALMCQENVIRHVGCSLVHDDRAARGH